MITYNHIHHCGLVYPSAVGINIDDGGGTIAHNLIHDITHSGVYTRHWATATQPKERRNQEQGLAIEFNEIFDVMLEHQRRRRDLRPRLEYRDQQQPDPRRLCGRRAMPGLGYLSGLRDARHQGRQTTSSMARWKTCMCGTTTAMS